MADHGHTPRFAKLAIGIARAEIIVDNALIYHDSPDSRKIEQK
jgi:hypothetical protein